MLVLVACVRTDTSTCPDGSVCAAGTICVQATPAIAVCVTPDRVGACTAEALEDGEPCDRGRCYAGACVAITCGDRLQDVDEEKCDDGNTASGDGCSADCRSDETCPNGVVDLVRGESCDDGNRLARDGCTTSCTFEAPQWTELRRPSLRTGSAMAWDRRGHRMLMYGGREGSLAVSDTWQWTATGWDRLFEISAPGPLQGHAMAYDAVNDQIVLTGGSDGGLSLTGATWIWDGAWSFGKALPVQLTSHAMVYDSARQTFVVFGGEQSSGAGPSQAGNAHFEGAGIAPWTELSLLPRPPARSSHAMAYDPRRRKVVVFGGADENKVLLDDLWEYDETTGWQPISISGPGPRLGASMAFDGEQLVLYGGSGPTGNPLRETWLWDGSTWTDATDGEPDARFQPAMASDGEHGTIVLAGGSTSSTCQWSVDRWTCTDHDFPARIAGAALDDVTRQVVFLDNDGKTYRSVGGAITTLPLPPLGFDPTTRLVFDRTQREFVLLDTSGTSVLRDGASAWLRLAARNAGPQNATRPAMTYDHARSRTVLFGGLTHKETWEWDGASWHGPLAPTTAPPPRQNTMIAYDPVRKRTVLFGGLDLVTNLPRDDTWSWDGTSWTQHEVELAPPPRIDSAMGWNPSRRVLVVIGGRAQEDVLDDVWEWNGEAWTRLSPSGTAPLARFEHQVVQAADGSGVQLFGGKNGVVLFSDLWILSWQGSEQFDTCRSPDDDDGDGLSGCADPDCWAVCDPTCSPGIAECPSSTLACGDGVPAPLETCSMCPDLACPQCGNLTCDPGEPADCPGDCP